MKSNIQTNIPPTELNLILQTKLSVESIVVLLNEKENFYSIERKHLNQKRTYPFWKVCQHCNKPFQALTKEQATRNKTCSKECAAAQNSLSKKGKLKPIDQSKKTLVNCAVCKKEFVQFDCYLKRIKKPTCSRQCNGKLRGQDWKEHAHKGRANWTPESELALKERMTGEKNPFWKGGLTVRKGKYGNQAIKYVRCPIEFISMSRKDGYVMEHRLKVAIAINRTLTRTECVHHINHDATDNRLENLMLFATNQDHKKYEAGQAIKPLWKP